MATKTQFSQKKKFEKKKKKTIVLLQKVSKHYSFNLLFRRGSIRYYRQSDKILATWPLHSLEWWATGKKKTTPKTQTIISIGEDVGKLESLYTVSTDVKWCSCYRKQYGHSSRN